MTRPRAWNSTLPARVERMDRGAGPARTGWVRKPARTRENPVICPTCRLWLPSDVEDVDPQLVCQCGTDWGSAPVPTPRRSSLTRSSERTHAASGRPIETAPKQRQPLPPVSAKRTAENRVRREVLRGMFAADPWCRARIEEVCDGLAVDGHEVLSRARGGSIADETNIALLCRPCHTHITDEPAWAEANGWSLSQYERTSK